MRLPHRWRLPLSIGPSLLPELDVRWTLHKWYPHARFAVAVAAGRSRPEMTYRFSPDISARATARNSAPPHGKER